MHVRTLLAMTAAGVLATPMAAVANPVTITATGTAQVRVRPADRHSNASIAAAELAAAKAGVPLALTAAQARASTYAAAAGLTLGPLVAISDQAGFNPFFSQSQPFPGPFGPGRFCGTVRILIGRPKPTVTVIGGRTVIAPPKHLRFRKVHRCFVPSPLSTTLEATYSAS